MSLFPNPRLSLLERIKEAISDFTNAHASMHIPVQETDVDIVLADCREEIERLTRELAQTAERADREARLACDLRTSQDETIERCARAVEEWPDAAARLRHHCGGVW